MKFTIKKIFITAMALSLILSLTMVAFAASSVSGLPISMTMKVGQVTTWNPNPAGGEWTHDKSFLSFDKNGSLATVTALKEGQTKVEYSPGLENDPWIITVTITSNDDQSPSSEASSSQASYQVSSSQASSTAASSVNSSESVSSDTSSVVSSKVDNPASGYSDTFAIIIAVVSVIAIVITVWNRKFIKE